MVFDEQRKTYGYTREAVAETIRICRDRNVLKEYLDSREKEVVDIMMTLFDNEQIMKNHDAALIRVVREETTKKVREETTKKVREETTKKVREETTQQVAEKVRKETEDKAIKLLIGAYKESNKTMLDVVQEIVSGFGLSEQESRSIVEKYWLSGL